MTQERPRSLPRSFHFTWNFSKLFKRKQFYSLSGGNNSFRTINRRNEAGLPSFEKSERDQAQVWSIRNRDCKSLVDIDDVITTDEGINTDDGSKTSNEKKGGNATIGNTTVGNTTFGNTTVGNTTVGNTTVGNHRFDVLGNWKQFFVHGFDTAISGRENLDQNEHLCSGSTEDVCNASKMDPSSESFPFYGSSDSVSCSPMSTHRECSTTRDSMETLDDLDISYWDIRIPDPDYSPVTSRCIDASNPTGRRFSESAAMNSPVGSPNLRHELSRRRFSESSAIKSPFGSPNLGRELSHRRFSESATMKSPFGSPNLRKELAHRRLSENFATYKFDRNRRLSVDGADAEIDEWEHSGMPLHTGRRMSEGQTLLHNNQAHTCHWDRSRSLRERRHTIIEGEVSPTVPMCRRCRHASEPRHGDDDISASPEYHTDVQMRRQRSLEPSKAPGESSGFSKKQRLHRSRSAEARSHRSLAARKRNSFSVGSQFTFSDIESSDENECHDVGNKQRARLTAKRVQDEDSSFNTSSSISEESDKPTTSSDTKESDKSISSSIGDDCSLNCSSNDTSDVQPHDIREPDNRKSKPAEVNTSDLSVKVDIQDEATKNDNAVPSNQSLNKTEERKVESSESKDADMNKIMPSEWEGREESAGNVAEFNSMLLEDVLFCSGKHGTLPDGGDDVEMVFEAVSEETHKPENESKDMIVMFLVGGEVKVLRRKSGKLGHVESIRSDLPSMTRKDISSHNGTHDHGHGQTIHDVNRGRPKSAIIVTRSQSFAGMAHPQPPVTMASGRHRDPPPGGVVLGESFRHHHRGPAVPQHATSRASSMGYKKSPKVPKVPRPNRALLMFQSVKQGIKEFIVATKDDIDELQRRGIDGTSTAQGRVHETDKQMKSAERYLKRLEFHHAKLDELHEYYMLQQQLREGVRTMHRAYVTSPGKQRNTLSNVKYGYKECTQTMCGIEAQLEAMMGTFNCKLKGIAGFARLCPGDVFEVTVRHGSQKWKTKGRIEKSGNQKWDVPEFNFKAIVGDIINIKGVEVRAFKSILLGQKSCETKDLFSANPQLMTVSINVNGSLKLSVVITWNPLDGVEESASFVDVPTKSQGTPRRRPVSVIALNGELYSEGDQYMNERRHSNPAGTTSLQQTKDDNFILRTNAPVTSSGQTSNMNSYHGLDSPHVGSRLHEHLPSAYQHHQPGPLQSQAVVGHHSSTPVLSSNENSDFMRSLPHPPSDNQTSASYSSNYVSGLPLMAGHLHFPSVSLPGHGGGVDEGDNSVLNIEDVLHNLSSALEDYHGQYSELQGLEDAVKFARKLLRKQFRRSSSRSSSISVSIEDALEAFDFLNTEETAEDPQSPTTTNGKMKSTYDDMLCSPESTAKTGDSGIESLAQRLSDDTQLGSSVGSSPVPPSTGNEEVDQCLLYHFIYCERLLENLGAFGPLKCREIYALDKLRKQTSIVNSLLKLAKSSSQTDLHSVMSSICEDKSLREFWVKCTGDTSLYINPDKLLNMLEQKYSSVISEKYAMDPNKVCQHVITRVLDIPDYEMERGQPHFVLTLHQFMAYFTEEGGLNHVENVAQEMKLVEKLTSGNPDMVIKAILMLRDTLPSAPCLKVIGMLLVTMDKEVEQCTISYLNLIQRKGEIRDHAMVVYVEGLEDRMAEIRSGACAALAILEASESIDRLVYLWQSDSSSMVQQAAKDAVLSLGDEGRKAFEDAQLSKHGFQGFQVHK